ncbi:hypothetical protein N8368_03735 [Bacteroidia bacterium]|nr:hypothetical protein [Bacteroidia bacterium]MDC1395601.1 hypothetical protein [Bacteroidia bacterium]
MRFNLIVAFLLASSTCLYAQTDNEDVNQFIERYIENTSNEVDIQQFASDLLGYFNNPLDIDKVDASELFSAPFLTGFQSLEIIEHRKNFGNSISIYELQVLPSFDLEDIRNILPFVKIKSNPLALTSVSKIWKEGTHQFLSLAEITTPKNRGTTIADTLTEQTQSHYIGSPVYNNLRYRFDYKRHISFGVNMEKDANEPFLNSYNPNGYDYYSFYFSARDIGRLKAFHLGDYQANFGQGLTMSTGLAFGKSSIITNAKRNFNGFGAYRSLRENAYLRGTAVAFELNKFTVGVFASYKNVDGNAASEKDSLDSDAPLVTSNIQEDGGYHRSTSELEDKDVFSDFQTGLYAEYKLPFGRIGTANYARKLGGGART